MERKYGVTVYNQMMLSELSEELAGEGAVVWGDANCDGKLTNFLLCKLLKEIRELNNSKEKEDNLLSSGDYVKGIKDIKDKLKVLASK